MTRTLTLTPEKPARTVNFAKILPLFAQTEAHLIPARRGEVRLAKSSRAALAQRPTSLKPLPSATFSLPRASGTISQALGITDARELRLEELRLPPGMPR